MNLLYSLIISPIELVIEVIFVIACRLFVHPGFAIIVVSLAINLLILPMYRHADALQEKERDKQGQMADTVKHLRKTFSGNERFMMLQTYYKQQDYRPFYALRGSLSLLLQIPFFIAAYHFLSNLKSLHHTPFLHIADLGAPDGLLRLGDATIHLLPIVMTLINIISGVLYLRGAQMREKVQVYLMAVFFLVLLYNSPSGLVLYWTCNNIFSLCKNILAKTRHQKASVCLLSAIGGMLLLILMRTGILPSKFTTHVISYALIIAASIVLLFSLLRKHKSESGSTQLLLQPTASPEKNAWCSFFIGSLLLTLLTGLVIPSALLAISPTDFIDLSHYVNPLLNYLPYSFLLAAGCFLVWAQILFLFSSDRFKRAAAFLIPALAILACVNYLFFGKNYGLISAELIYDAEPSPSSSERLVNLCVLFLLLVILLFLRKRFRQLPVQICAVLCIAAALLGIVQIRNTAQGLADVDRMIAERREKTSDNGKLFTLSTQGNNVIVFMLDKAMGPWIPYIFEELPRLKEQFDGFCYYPNTVSQGGSTLFGTPGLFGGYEYTPANMSTRTDMLLKDKHNEALSLMPLMFRREGYRVTVCDQPFGDYSFETVSDLSLYDEWPDIDVYYSADIDALNEGLPQQTERRRRNFFCYGIMRGAPVFLHQVLYWNGTYFSSDMEGAYTGEKFLKQYTVLANLETLTQISDSTESHFLILCNETTHEFAELQMPDYEPVVLPDNSAYNTSHRETSDGGHLSLTPRQFQLYCTNAAAFLKVGEWLDTLRAAGVYDNTRIILAADHGADSEEGLQSDGLDINIDRYMPLLMVKDFHAHGFTVDRRFMTNADTPFLAMHGIINDMHNPYTGVLIDSAQKTLPQYVIIEGSRNFYDYRERTDFEVDGTVWYAVSEDVADPVNWTKITAIPK